MSVKKHERKARAGKKRAKHDIFTKRNADKPRHKKRIEKPKKPNVPHHPCVDMIQDAARTCIETISSTSERDLESSQGHVKTRLENLRLTDERQYADAQDMLQSTLRPLGETELTMRGKDQAGQSFETMQTLSKTMLDFQGAAAKRFEIIKGLFARKADNNENIQALRVEMLDAVQDFDVSEAMDVSIRKEIEQVASGLKTEADKLAADEANRRRDIRRVQKELLKLAGWP